MPAAHRQWGRRQKVDNAAAGGRRSSEQRGGVGGGGRWRGIEESLCGAAGTAAMVELGDRTEKENPGGGSIPIYGGLTN